MIHNHNIKSSFSAQDIVALLRDENAIAIIVITCNANIFILVKEKNKDYSNILKNINSNYKTDFITPDTRKLMTESGLIERKVTTWKNISPTVRTDAGVLERRQAQRRWSGREQDGVASEHNGALPQRGRFGSSITPNLCVLCYSLHPHCLQAFPTSYSFPIPCVRVEKHEHFLFPHFFHFFLKE